MFLQTRDEWSFEGRISNQIFGDNELRSVVGALSMNINDVMYTTVHKWLEDVLHCSCHLEISLGNVIGLRPTSFRSSMILDMYDFTLEAREVTNTTVPPWFNYKEYLWQKK